MRVGKIAGVQLTLNNWFLCLIVLFGFVGMAGKALGIFASVLWHETAHALAAAALGYRVREIELLPFGGVARIERLNEAGSASEMIMAAAGPLSSLALAAAIYLMITGAPEWKGILEFYLTANLMLAAFNMLPALPLDGGRLLRAWLSMRWDYGTATGAVVRVTKLISFTLIGWTLADFILTSTVNLTFLMAAVFLYAGAKAELRTVGFRAMRILARKKEQLSERGVMPTTHFTAVASVPAREVVRLFGPEQYHVVLVVDQGFRLRGSLTETEVWEALPERGPSTAIGEFL